MQPSSALSPSAAGRHGVDALKDPFVNKGLAFSQAEREQLGVVGLLPPAVRSRADQVRVRCYTPLICFPLRAEFFQSCPS